MKSVNRVEITGQLHYIEEKGSVTRATIRYYTGNRTGKPYENIRVVAVDHTAKFLLRLPLKTMIKVNGKLKDNGVVLAEKVFLAGGANQRMEDALSRMGRKPEDELPW